MPMAPSLPPEVMAKAQASAGLAPANFLIAAASLHNEGSLSAPAGDDRPLGGKTTNRKHLKAVVK